MNLIGHILPVDLHGRMKGKKERLRIMMLDWLTAIESETTC